MRVSALVMAILLVATPALPQSASPPETQRGAHDRDTTLVEIPEDLQRVFDLVKQPGIHTELLELLEIEVSPERPLGAPPAAGIHFVNWIWIGVGAVALLLLVFALTYDVCTGPITCGH